MDSPVSGDASETLEEHIAAGGDRRSFIKKGMLIAGGLWVAPLAAEHLLTPAFGSIQCTCTTGTLQKLQFNLSTGGGSSGTAACVAPGTPPTACTPACWSTAVAGNCGALPFSVTPSKPSSNEQVILVMNVTGSLFLDGRGPDANNACKAAVIDAVGGKSRLSFIPGTGTSTLYLTYCA